MTENQLAAQLGTSADVVRRTVRLLIEDCAAMGLLPTRHCTPKIWPCRWVHRGIQKDAHTLEAAMQVEPHLRELIDKMCGKGTYQRNLARPGRKH